MNKKVFEVDGKKYVALRPTHKHLQKAQQVYNRAFREAVESGAIVRARVESVMREQKLWDDEKRGRFDQLVKQLLEAEMALAKGGIKKSEAKKMAVQMRIDRAELRSLSMDRNRLDQFTCESQAEQARFNYLVSTCTVYGEGDQEGKPVFSGVEEYLEKDDEMSNEAAATFAKLYYNYDDEHEAKLPENKFLVKYGFCNDKLHLVDDRGRPVNTDGKLVDDKGRFVNEEGQLVDNEGNLLTDDGEYKVEFQEFLDG